MPISRTSQVIEALAQEVGPDAHYLRRAADRKYLSGFDVAELFASAIFAAFVAGVIKASLSRAKALGEAAGNAVFDLAERRLRALFGQLIATDTHDPDHLKERVRNAKEELEEIIEPEEVRGLLTDGSPPDSTDFVTALQAIGVPADDAKDLAERYQAFIIASLRRDGP